MKRFLIALAIVFGLLAALIIVATFDSLRRPCGSELGCAHVAEVRLLSETEVAQWAMDTMMKDKSITTVTPNDDTNNSLGVNTWTALPRGRGAAPLAGYLKESNTNFYYCWDSKGNVYAQNKTDGVRAEPKDADKQRPCKKNPSGPS